MDIGKPYFGKYSHLTINSSVESYGDPDREDFVVSKVVIDENTFEPDLTLDWRELFLSLRFSGEFFPLTCSCGEPGCAGVWEGIRIVHSPGMVVWDVNVPYSEPYDAAEHEPSVMRLQFRRDQYFSSIISGWLEARALSTTNPSCTIGPYGFSGQAFIDLPSWLKEHKGRNPELEWKQDFDSVIAVLGDHLADP